MNIVKQEFNSLSEIPAWLDAHPRAQGCNNASQDSEYRPSDSWDLGLGYKGAVEMTGRGGDWEEGAKRMKEVTVIMGNLKRNEPSLQLDTDVCGFAVDVGSYLAGDPCCMWNEGEDDSRPVPIIKIGVNTFMSAAIKSEQRVNYGAAILSVIDSIEETGARVELWAGLGSQSSEIKTDFRALVKPAHEHWSPGTAAFALAHPAFNRRIMFRIGEAFPELKGWTHGGCYGGSSTVGKEDFDLYFPALTTRDDVSWSDTAAGALKHVTELAQSQLNQQEKAA
jgi:hypothetical protein